MKKLLSEFELALFAVIFAILIFAFILLTITSPLINNKIDSEDEDLWFPKLFFVEPRSEPLKIPSQSFIPNESILIIDEVK